MDDLFKASEKNIRKLEASISHIEVRQQEIQNIIATIQNNLYHLESIIQGEETKPNPNNEKLKNLRLAILKNVSIIREMYDTYDSYEETKFKYKKLITETDFNYRKLDITIKQTEDKMQKSNSSDLVDLLRIISSNLNSCDKNNNKNYVNKIENEIIVDPEMQL